MRRLIFHPSAIRDLGEVRRWYRQAGAGAVAARKLDTIRGAIRRLRDEQWCRSGRELDGGDRMLVTEGHTVLYRLPPGSVLVLRVFQPGRNRPV